MVGLFSENPFVGYCLNKAFSKAFNLDFSLPYSFRAEKYVLQSIVNKPYTECRWSYPVSWNIYYGNNFSNLELLTSEKDNTILSTSGTSFEIRVKPFKASAIRFQVVKINNIEQAFGLSQFDFFGEIESGKNICRSVFCQVTCFEKNFILFIYNFVFS